MDPRYETAAGLARLYRIPRGTIYYWAHVDEWRRLPGRPVGYLRADAQASYDRRRGDEQASEDRALQALPPVG